MLPMMFNQGIQTRQDPLLKRAPYLLTNGHFGLGVKISGGSGEEAERMTCRRYHTIHSRDSTVTYHCHAISDDY